MRRGKDGFSGIELGSAEISGIITIKRSPHLIPEARFGHYCRCLRSSLTSWPWLMPHSGFLPAASDGLQPANQQFALVDHLRWQMVMQVEEEFLVADHLSPPCGAIHGLELFKLLARKLEPRPLDILVARHPANGRFAPLCAPVHAIHNPSKNAHILAEAGPQKLPMCVFAKPVHIEDAWR